ncbi:hypothetical protein DMA11_17680 [Marinilabiliaceae bacterium JC017]|nr:hypothetical protein DMA11_17680 [Marinilabiliaceae bacterium JC017]
MEDLERIKDDMSLLSKTGKFGRNGLGANQCTYPLGLLIMVFFLYIVISINIREPNCMLISTNKSKEKNKY